VFASGEQSEAIWYALPIYLQWRAMTNKMHSTMENEEMRNIIILAFILAFAIGGVAMAGQGGPSSARYDGLYPVEYSCERDRQAIPPGAGPLDQLQVLFTRPVDLAGPQWPDNTFDYDNNTFEQDGPEQVDALANMGDFLFHELLANRADLLISFRLLGPSDAGAGPDAVYFETPVGGVGTKWTQIDLDADAPGVMENLDGLEVWGPDLDDDAYMYSVEGDATLGLGNSVFAFPPPFPTGPYVPLAAVQAACVVLGYQGGDVDLDGLMVYDSSVDAGDFDNQFGPNDEIIFSIRASGNWDGGEIVHLKGDGSVAFLNHGGHIWNTAFDISGTFEVQTEEVDAIEAMIHSNIPSMTGYGIIVLVLLILASGMFVIIRRRKAVEA
jgi:hypothetical protein